MHTVGDSIILTYEVLANDFERAGEVSSNIKNTLKQLGIAQKTIRKVAVASYEAEINIIIHSNGGHIQAEISKQEVKLIFTDSGPGIENIELAMQEGYSTASDEVREMGFGAGMGLPNIQRCADLFHIESSVEGTKIKVVFLVE